MTIIRAKSANRFRVQFDKFGTDQQQEHMSAQVLRVTRPGVMFYSVFGTPQVTKTNITLDLRDDVSDYARHEVITQVNRQNDAGSTFALTIEALDSSSTDTVLERWYFTDCRIVECLFDEFDNGKRDGLTIRLVIEPGRVEATLNGESVEFVGKQPTNGD